MNIVLLAITAQQQRPAESTEAEHLLRQAGASAGASAGAGDVATYQAADAAAVDAAIGDLAGRRLVLDADAAGLNLALARLLRAGLLATVETAVLAREEIGYLRRIGLPGDREAQARIAVSGRCRLVGVIKDDSGGVCVDTATVTAWQGDDDAGSGGGSRSAGWWLRAVVDDQRLADGIARSVSVRRLGPDELEATVRLTNLRRRRMRGRSLQLACDPALVVQDGIARERPRGKRTLWSEPALWWLASPSNGPVSVGAHKLAL